MSYIDDDIYLECGEEETICQRCGHDNQDDITQCEKCGRYFCDLCMSEEDNLCKSCNDEY